MESSYLSRVFSWQSIAASVSVSYLLTSIIISAVVSEGLPILYVITHFLTIGIPGLNPIILPLIGTVPPLVLFLIIAIVFSFIFNALFPSSQEDVNYLLSCKPYAPPAKGEDCKLCNDKNKFRECTEYLCLSLGKACELINKNSPGNQTCIWKDPSNTLPPIIGPLPIAPLTLNDLIITPSTAGKQGGYEFKNTLKSFDFVDIGIETSTLDKKTNKLRPAAATCKISRKINFDYETEGEFIAGSDVALFENTKRIPIATKGIAPDEDRIELETGKENVFYVKCQSVNGIVNANSYFIKLRLEVGPDLSPPLITGFSTPDNSFIKYNQNQINNLVLYYEDQTGAANSKIGFNGGCKYSQADQDYNLMENNMSCALTRLNSGPNQGKFACTTNLKLDPNQDNTFYFRCRDVSERQNVNIQSKILNLKTSQSLKIIDKGPGGNILTTKVNLTLTTDIGAENGKATCYYLGGLKEFITKDLTFSPSGIKFTSTNSNQHESKLSLQNEKDYLYYAWCRDIAGNEAHDKIEFHTTTPDLNITEAIPDNTVINLEEFQLRVTTVNGIHGNGDSTCTYGGDLNGYFNEDKQVLQDKTIQTKNITIKAQNLKYNVNITCTDQYKSDKKTINFRINTITYPKITRVYREGSLLTILLDQPAKCRYTTNNPNFNYEDISSSPESKAVDMADVTQYKKQSQIKSNVVYIKCQDINTKQISQTYTIYP